MELFKRGVKTFFWTLAGSTLGFIFQLYAAKILGASEYGKANVVLGISGTFIVFTSFGLTTLLVREVSKFPENSREILSRIFSTQILIDLLSFPLILPIALHLLKKTELTSPIYTFLVVSILFATQLNSITYSYYNGLRKQTFSSFTTNFLSRVLKIIVFSVFMSLSKIDHLYFLAATIVSLSPGAFLAFYNLKGFRIKGVFEIIGSSWQFYTISILYSLYSHLSKVLQRMYAGDEEVGVLSVGMTLGTVGTLLGMTFATMAMPEFASAWKERDLERINRVFKDVSRWNAYIMIPVVTFFLTNIERILSYLGKDYSKGGLIVGLILSAQFFNSLVGPNGTLLSMSGYQRFEIYNGIAMIAAALSSGLIMGPRTDWGIAFSVAISIFVVNVLKLLEVRRIFGIYPYGKRTLLHIALIALVSGVLGSLRVKSDFLWLVYSALWIIGVISLGFILSPEKDDRRMIARIARRLGSHR